MTYDWIPVTDRYPEIGKEVFVAVKGCDKPCFGTYLVENEDGEGDFYYWKVVKDGWESTMWALSMGEPKWYHDVVTHWMPMIKMPDKED